MAYPFSGRARSREPVHHYKFEDVEDVEDTKKTGLQSQLTHWQSHNKECLSFLAAQWEKVEVDIAKRNVTVAKSELPAAKASVQVIAQLTAKASVQVNAPPAGWQRNAQGSKRQAGRGARSGPALQWQHQKVLTLEEAQVRPYVQGKVYHPGPYPKKRMH